MFIPKLQHQRALAELTTVTPLGAPELKSGSQWPYRSVSNPPNLSKDDFGWFDNNGDLRPRSWEEYVKYRSAFIGSPFEDRAIKSRIVKPKRNAICTIGELLRYRKELQCKP